MAFDFSAYLELLRNIGGFVLLLGEFLVAFRVLALRKQLFITSVVLQGATSFPGLFFLRWVRKGGGGNAQSDQCFLEIVASHQYSPLLLSRRNILEWSFWNKGAQRLSNQLQEQKCQLQTKLSSVGPNKFNACVLHHFFQRLTVTLTPKFLSRLILRRRSHLKIKKMVWYLSSMI